MSESYNHEWWFLSAFIFTVLTLPILERMPYKFRSFWSGLTFVAGLELIFTVIVPFIESSSFPIDTKASFVFSRIIHGLKLSTPFYMGMLMGINNNLEQLHNALKECHLTSPFAALLALGASILLRNYVLGDSSDPFTIPFVVLAIKDLLDSFKPLKSCSMLLGEHSTTMWLTHTFFLYYFCKEIQGFIMFQHWWLLTLIWFVTFSLLSAILFDSFWQLLSDRVSRIFLNRTTR